MWRYSKKEKDLEEIFLHIQDIIEERNLDNELKQIEILQENLKKTAGELDINNYSKDDIFEVVEDDEIEDHQTVMTSDFVLKGFCDFCNEEIDFENNLSGLVLKDKSFVCQKCCTNANKETLEKWVETKMATQKDVKPIALWLMEIKNKSRLFY